MGMTGGALGAVTGAAQLGELLIASNEGEAIDPRTGTRFTWGALVLKLLGAASDYREARDNFRQIEAHDLAQEAEAGRSAVMAVYDGLTELYREWPELGLDAEGRLDGLPAALVAIAGIVGGAAIWWWAIGQAAQALRLLLLSRSEETACEDDPAGQDCADARERRKEAERTLRESGVQITGAGFGAVGLLLGGLAVFALSRR